MEICDKARELVRTENRQKLDDLGNLLRLCESPVEQILLAALYNLWGGEVNHELKRLQCQFSADYPAWDGIFLACCEPQRTIITWSDRSYRVDLYIYLTRYRHHHHGPNREHWPEFARLVVEVDGHEFHDRTKQQASYDRQRDRALLVEGYRVIRFTGSDVFNDPDLCVYDINCQVNELASEVLNDYIEKGKLEELIIG